MTEYVRQKALILGGEESFARAVALGVTVKRPVSAYHFLLPGMFLFDFLRRSSETKRYSELFLFPRKLALEGAFDLLNGKSKKGLLSQAEEGIKRWKVKTNREKANAEVLLRACITKNVRNTVQNSKPYLTRFLC